MVRKLETTAIRLTNQMKTTMKTLLGLSVFALVGLCPAPVRAQDAPVASPDLAATITACERSSWAAFQAGDPVRFRALCCEEFYEITGEGSLLTLGEILADMPNYVTKRFTMSNAVVTVLADNVCLIRYQLRVEYRYKGEDLPAQAWFASAVWVKRAGRWLAATYQESPLPR